jgi:hypothetical protein
MNRPVLFLLLVGASQLVTGCQHDVDIRPANYDELGLGTGHWEWDVSTLGWAGNRTPVTEGYSRQLVFGSGGQLLLRRSGQGDYRTSYQLSMGPLPRCGNKQANFPIVTYSTGEEKLPNNERKTYTISQQQGQQVLRIVGEDACVDGGAYETYHWVAE